MIHHSRDVTDRDINELSEEAGAARDYATLRDCEKAIKGVKAARKRVGRIILELRREREYQAACQGRAP